MPYRFFIFESLVEGGFRFKTWIGTRGVSDHLSTVLQVDKGKENKSYPFKFNHGWLLEEEFKKVIQST